MTNASFDPMMDDQIWAQRRQGAEDARHCKEICLHTAEILLGREASQLNPDLVLMLGDCGEMNQLAENYLLRGSMNVGIACNTASEVCLACAQHCERFQDDEVLHECAQTCRDTMESLRRIGAVGA